MCVCEKLFIMSIRRFILFLSFEGRKTYANQIPFLFDGIMDMVLNRDSENQNLVQSPYDWT